MVAYLADSMSRHPCGRGLLDFSPIETTIYIMLGPVRNNTLYYRVRYRKCRDCRASILHRPKTPKGDRAQFQHARFQTVISSDTLDIHIEI